MVSAEEERLNLYDADGRVVGAKPRREAKASGLAVGAVNALIVDRRRHVLLQRRPPGKDNAERWDKSVGGHVSAGEEFDQTLVREAGEELFDDPRSPRICLAASAEEFASRLLSADLAHEVVMRRVAFQKSLRDVRAGPGGAMRNVLYHVAIYAGRTDVPVASFRPQPSEIDELAYFPAEGVDRMLLEGRLAPNMAFLWLTQAHALLSGG
jgi:isopentenyldiphosphate isomerase